MIKGLFRMISKAVSFLCVLLVLFICTAIVFPQSQAGGLFRATVFFALKKISTPPTATQIVSGYVGLYEDTSENLHHITYDGIDSKINMSYAVSATATSTGATTGTIPDYATFVTAANGGSANNIIIIPVPSVGKKLQILTTGALELRTTSPTTIAINGGTGSAAESAVASGQLVTLTGISATAWRAYEQSADSTLSKTEAAAP